MEQTRNCIKRDSNKQIRQKSIQLIKLSSRIRIDKIKNQLLYNLKNKCGRAKKIKNSTKDKDLNLTFAFINTLF